MNKENGDTFAKGFLLILFFLVLFYMLTFFLRFQISNFTGASFCLLAVLVILTSFTAGIFFNSWQALSSAGNLLVSLAVLGLFMVTIVLISAAGTNVLGVISLIALPFFLFNVFILVLFVKRFLNKRTDTTAAVAKIVAPYSKRAEPRIKDYLSAQLLSEQGDWQPIKVYDFSTKGMRLIGHRPFKEEEMMDLKIIIPYDSRAVFARAKVIWAKELSLAEKEFHAGVQFVEIDPSDKVRLMLKQVYSLFQENIA